MVAVLEECRSFGGEALLVPQLLPIIEKHIKDPIWK